MARLIEDSSRRSVVSMASLWEISIKASLGKLNFPPADDPDLPALLLRGGLRCATHLLACDPARQPISLASPRSVYRYIAAEALTRDAPVLSIDAKLDHYGVERIGE